MLSGSTPIALIGEGNVIGQFEAGSINPLVMVNNIRSPNFPNVPTLEQTGYTGAPSRSWYGLFTPAGTPRPIVDKIAKDVAGIVNDPAFREPPPDRAQPHSCDQLAGAVRRRDQGGSRDRATSRQGRRFDAAVATPPRAESR